MKRTLQILFVLLTMSNWGLAQSELNTMSFKGENNYLGSKGLLSSFPGISSSALLSTETIRSDFLEFSPQNPGFFSHPLSSKSSISYRMGKEEDYFHGLGGFEHFTNSITYHMNNKLSFTLTGGLLKHSSILYPGVHFQNSITASINYQFTPNLGGYVFGRHYTPLFNKEQKIIDPYNPLNPATINAEIGAGIKTQIGNVKARFEIRASYNNNSPIPGGFNSMNSKFGF